MEFSALIKGMVGWKAVVDIVLIAAGLFFLYHTLMRLGTWRIVAGIVLAACLFLMANLVDLKGLESIFGNFSQRKIIIQNCYKSCICLNLLCLRSGFVSKLIE